MRRRSDRQNSFHVKANRTLDRELGQFDAMIQYQEIALLELVKQKNNAKTDDYIYDLAKAHGIPLSHIPFDNCLSRLSQSYLIYPNACFDSFIDNFTTELKCLLRNYSTDQIDGETKLAKVMNSLQKKYSIRIIIPQNLIYAYNYYRHSRNYLAHHNPNDLKLQKDFNQIDIKDFLKLVPGWQGALKECGVYTLDDAIAFSALVKRLADTISQQLYPQINWADIIFEEDSEWMVFIRKLKSKPDKEVSLQGFVKSKYGERIPDSQINQLLKRLMGNN